MLGWLILAGAWVLPVSANDQSEACLPASGSRHAVSRVIDAETLRLDDGREVRLAGIAAPRAADSGGSPPQWPPATAAQAALEGLVLGQSVELRYAGAATDRYQRLVAQVLAGDGATRTWVQAALVEAGHARALVAPGLTGCLGALMAREATALAAGRGLWSHAAYAIRDGGRAFELLRHRATFQVVEARVQRVDQVRGRVYLNFGEDWRRDFTIGIKLGGRTGVQGEAVHDLAGLAGALVRVRGWIERRNGPFIELVDWRALEVLEDAGVRGADPVATRRRAPTQPVAAREWPVRDRSAR